MTPFIDCLDFKVIVDGSVEEIQSKATHLSEGKAVQLARAQQVESGFNWLGRKVKKVILRNVLIFDETDVSCLRWFITSKIKIDASQARISPNALIEFNKALESLMKRSIEVVKGSTIRLPIVSDISRMGSIEKATELSQKIGFKLV